MLDHQRELAAALAAKDGRLARMYLGCVHVLADTANPDALALAAYAARELMRAVPKAFDVPMKAHEEGGWVKVRVLEDKWASTIARTACRQEGGDWDGPIDRHLKALLRAFDEYFAWMREHMPRRKAETMVAIRRLENARPLPEHLEVMNVAKWEDLASYFNRILHHGVEPERRTLEEALYSLEYFLLARMKPRTFDDFAEIDALLRGGND
jgi:hypothetical protein